MKKLINSFRKWLLFAFIMLALGTCCVFGVTVQPLTTTDAVVAGGLDDDSFKIEATGDSAEDGYQVTDKFSKTMIDHDEQRVRNYVSDHEIPKDVPAKVKIIGDLATPPPKSNIELGFIPKQTYVQVRRSDKEVHLPRSAALAEAETAEDVLNAPRLREVISQKKTQEVS